MKCLGHWLVIKNTCMIIKWRFVCCFLPARVRIVLHSLDYNYASILYFHASHYFLSICFAIAMKFQRQIVEFDLNRKMCSIYNKNGNHERVFTVAFAQHKCCSKENYDQRTWWDPVLITLDLFLSFFGTKKPCSNIGYKIDERMKPNETIKT